MKMKVEVWSDIMCPFCYIGKRNYERALEQIADADKIEIEWKSFQLDPTIPQKIENKKSVYQYLAERKGMSVEQSQRMHSNVVNTAKNAGLEYNFDKAVIANSFDAHRIIQLAKNKKLGDVAEETFFFAYFTDGKDLGEYDTLLELGQKIGLEEAEIRDVLDTNKYADEVKQDIQLASTFGIQGVPFFVIDRKYGISGAQPIEIFKQTLDQAISEWKQEQNPAKLETIQGETCSIDGNC
jgi:predicted DsbA family dithiol-disulfide isomerase